ncbi:MAG: hypothetical protein ABH889_01075 [Candidatus Portnoybacteria bacterium]
MPDFSEQLNQDRANDSNLKKKKKAEVKKLDSPASQIFDVEFFLVFGLAVLKDTLDWILLFAGGIGLILSRITNLIITGILWLWCLFRLHRFPTKRFLASFLIEMIPIVGTFSPTWTIFIATIWAEQKGYLPKWADELVGAKS